MTTRPVLRRLTWCLVISVAIILTVTSAMGTVYQRDKTYDGIWQTGDNGWQYCYFYPGDYAWWKNNGTLRLGYNYTYGQWWDCDKFGTWRGIGAGGVTTWWIGDGGWHSLNNGWSYMYNSSGDFAGWTVNGHARLSYQYGNGQWWDYGTAWNTIGGLNASSAFVGDGGWHSLNNGWSYMYNSSGDFASWNYNGSPRYEYQYSLGQWWDYTVNGWGKLGVGFVASSQFIGDGAWHQFSSGDYFHGDGTSYYWYSGTHDRYQYTFGSGLWNYWTGTAWSSLTFGSTWQNPDCRYLYSAKFVESGLASDTGIGAPAGRKELQYNVYNYTTGSRSRLTGWKIHNAGTDNRWSGGDLNVAWGNTRHWNGTAWVNDFNQAFGEFTKEDVIFFAADFEQNPIGFSTMVDWMTLARDYYSKQVRTVQVMAHGNETGWEMGQWMSLSNYTSFQNDWQRWGGLMTNDGQIISIHCDSGQATAMLNAIATWSGCDIYANTNTTWTAYNLVNSNYSEGNASVWNFNYGKLDWYDDGTYNPNNPASTRYFEYTTTGLQDYRWLFNP